MSTSCCSPTSASAANTNTTPSTKTPKLDPTTSQPHSSQSKLPTAINEVTPEEWREARIALLAEEKALTRASTALAAKRAQLPMVRLTTTYTFDTPTRGRVPLLHLFNGHRQLIVQHLMFDGKEMPTANVACKNCSFMCDTLNGATLHLPSYGTSFVAISDAPMEKILAYKKRMGWTFPWVSAGGTSFNKDFHVGFPTAKDRESGEYNYRNVGASQTQMPGFSVFIRDDDGNVFHTYSTYGRGVESFIATYALLDITPLGRQEAPSKEYRVAFKQLPAGAEWGVPINGVNGPMGPIKRHDEYPYFDAEDMGKAWL